MNIIYCDDLEGISPSMLEGFFVGWPNPPKPETHLKLLQGSDAVVLAKDEETGRVVGFITAVTDHVLTAFLPLLEVLPEYQGQGIGGELVDRMADKLQHLYAVDLICDEGLVGYYEKRGFRPGRSMMLRNYGNQSGR